MGGILENASYTMITLETLLVVNENQTTLYAFPDLIVLNSSVIFFFLITLLQKYTIELQFYLLNSFKPCTGNQKKIVLYEYVKACL